MRRTIVGGVIALLLAAATAAFHVTLSAATDPTRRAVSSDAADACSACDELRALGPDGLDRLLAASERVLAHGPSDPAWARHTLAIDRVAGAYDGWASRLYWYTDLEAAKAAARASGRPILMLHLLGRLDEPLSCANSRFFRLALYPNAEVSSLLRERFVLCWESERPAPKITIDYGDGRVLERTITGNSLHEVLDADGRLVDAIPGMWTPAGFRTELASALELVRALRGLSEPERSVAFAKALGERSAARMSEWPEAMYAGVDRAPARMDFPPGAREAGNRAFLKAYSQMRMVAAVDPGFEDEASPKAWAEHAPEAIVRAVTAEAKLDAASLALLRLREGPGTGAPGAGDPGPDGERRFALRVESFERGMARDQIVNRYVFGESIRRGLARPDVVRDRRAFERFVYDEVFLTPERDPWLGLAPENAFSGIDRGGVTTAR